MEPVAVSEVPPSEPRPKSRKGLVAAVIGVAVVAGVLAFWRHYQQHHREQAAAHALDDLGALVVMDAARKHVGTVNLSTIETPEALGDAIEQLPALTHLTALDASRTAIGDAQLESVAALSRLESLTLNETGVTDDGLARLAGMSSLQALYLVKTGVTDGGVATLGKLSQLHILDLSATKVTDNLEPLAQLPQLRWLLLRELQLKDDALAKLAGCAALQQLSLEDSTYSADSVATLRDALPGLSGLPTVPAGAATSRNAP